MPRTAPSTLHTGSAIDTVFPARTWVFWRIDYHLATPALAAKARRESIYLAQRFSDHAPLTIEYDFAL